MGGILPFENNGLFGDLPVHDAVAAHDRCGVAEGDEHVVPRGIGGLGHVGGRGVGLGVGVGMEDAQDLHFFGFGVAVGLQVVERVDRVELGRGRVVASGVAGVG